LERVKPIYKTIPGWKQKTSDITQWEELPDGAREYLEFISSEIKVPIGIISLGPKRHQTIKLDM
jgi:adenylosuccinate synthase